MGVQPMRRSVVISQGQDFFRVGVGRPRVEVGSSYKNATTDWTQDISCFFKEAPLAGLLGGGEASLKKRSYQ